MQINYITKSAAFTECLKKINNISSFAIDLEFDKNRYGYGFNLCLVQIYTGETCFLLDPMSKEIDIQLLFPCLENKEIQKVVFAFGEDLRLLHSLGCFPKNLFDIAMAAKLLNYPPGSLAAIIETVLQIELNKSSQNSNWLKRPLTDNQMKYAADDVLYLLKLKTAIVHEAETKKKMEWVEQENAAFDQLSYAGIENNNFIKKKDKNGLSEFEWHLYKELLMYREKVAKKRGKPSYQVFNKDLIKELALQPDKINKWKNKKGIFNAFNSNGFRHELKKLIEEAEMQNLSKTEPANKPLGKEEALHFRRERSLAEKMKVQFFKPIQKEIAELHGEHAATIILGNRIVAAILTGDITGLKKYQLELLSNYADKLKIDLSSFFPTNNGKETK